MKKKTNGKPAKFTQPEEVTDGEQPEEKSDEERLADLKAKYPDLLVKILECEEALAKANEDRKNLETEIGEIVGHGGAVAIDGKTYLVRNRPDKHGGGLMLVDAAKRAEALRKTANSVENKLANPM